MYLQLESPLSAKGSVSYCQRVPHSEIGRHSADQRLESRSGPNVALKSSQISSAIDCGIGTTLWRAQQFMRFS